MVAYLPVEALRLAAPRDQVPTGAMVPVGTRGRGLTDGAPERNTPFSLALETRPEQH
jgi:hypothetical protein